MFSCSVMFDSFETPWTVTYWAPLSMGFPRQEYWSVLLFPSPEDLPNPGIESLMSPALAGGIVTIAPPRASLIAQLVKNLPAMQDTPVRFLGQEDPLEKGMATHSSILAWRIPCT